MALRTNKLIPVLVIVSLLILGFVAYTRYNTPSAVKAGPAMTNAPVPGGDSATTGRGSSLAGNLPATRSADADTPNDTLKTVTASNTELRATAERLMRTVAEQKEQLAQAAVHHSATEERITAAVMARMAGQAAAKVPAPSGSPGVVDGGVAAATKMIELVTGGGQPPAAPSAAGAAGGIPRGLGYDAASSTKTLLLPAGYRNETKDGKTAIVRELQPHRAAADPRQLLPADSPQQGQQGQQQLRADLVPYFTLPENATLAQSTAMTTLVGRVPVDGRVTDPMQFKLLVGRDNLAASGQYVPADLVGVVMSGIAIGDQALSCTEGLIHSMTFVFDDGTVRTVSQRTNGASTGLQSGGGSSGGKSITQASKLGWISDAFGNPCIPGRFVTNAPAYLADVIGAKAFSVAGAALAAAETTVTSGASALGATTSSTVTGDRGRYVLGRTVSAGTDEVVSWLMRRLNNSFDAVVVPAATTLVVHIDQEIAIDKDPVGRKLDYGRARMTLARQQGVSHGLD